MKLFKSLSSLRQFRTLIVAAVAWFSMLPAWSQDYLCFTAVNDNTEIQLVASDGSVSGVLPTVNLQYSYDGTNWNDWSITQSTKNVTKYYKYEYTYVGAGNGDYDRYWNWGQSGYSYVGSNQGSYVQTIVESNRWDYNYYQNVTIVSAETSSISLDAGEKVYLKEKGDNYRFAGTDVYFSDGDDSDCIKGSYWHFHFTNSVESSGNVMSLLDASCQQTYVPEYAFAGLFADENFRTVSSGMNGTQTVVYTTTFNLLSAPELPATTLGAYCYYGMFCGCRNLTAAPSLPATELKDYCYAYMFAGNYEMCSMDVAFKDWHSTATENWAIQTDRYTDYYHYVNPFGTVGVFKCPSELVEDGVEYGVSKVPSGWTVSGLNNDCLRFSWRATYGDGFVVSSNYHAEIKLEKSGSPETINLINLKYSKDGSAWYDFVVDGKCVSTIDLACGEVVYIRADEKGNDTFSPSSSNYYYFTETLYYQGNSRTNLKENNQEKGNTNILGYKTLEGVIEIGGNIMSLLDPNYTRMDVPDYAFYNLFGGPSGGSTKAVFSGPSLPAVELGQHCYEGMFKGLTYMNSAPELPATTEDLTESNSEGCYNYMFQNCTNLKYMNVGFNSWTVVTPAFTTDWVKGVSTTTGTFQCAEGLTIEYADNRVPTSWNNSSSEVGAVDDENDYLCLEVETAVGTVRLNRSDANLNNLSGLQYSYDKDSWSDYTWAGNSGKVITLNKQQGQYRVYFRSAKTDNTGSCSTSESSYYYFDLSGTFNASGNVMSLVRQDCQRYSVGDFMFYKLFAGCASLKSSPSLPATALGVSCYDHMYQGCLLLSSSPDLPATVMKKNCYRCMFEGCSKLTAVSTLPATSLAEGCYFQMFYNCSSLKSAPALPAADLITNCYNHMFDGCSSLSYISVGFTSWPTWWPADTSWVDGVNNTGVFAYPTGLDIKTFGPGRVPKNTTYPWTTMDNSTVGLYFEARRNGSSITLKKNGSPADVQLVYSEDDGVSWSTYTIGSTIKNINKSQRIYFKAGTEVNGQATDGVNETFSGPEKTNFYKFAMTGSFDANGNIMSLLDANCERTGLGDYAFFSLFNSCTKLKSAPLLPATTLGIGTYQQMFYGCTSLKETPALPATEMKTLCYCLMFGNCYNLSKASELPALTLASNCYQEMFENDTSLTVAPDLPATRLAGSCYWKMFTGCKNLQYINVKFSSWHNTATKDWVSDGANSFPTSGIFMCPDELPHSENAGYFGDSRIPKADEDGKRWIVNESAMYFTADNGKATIKLNQVGSPTAVTLKYSLDNALSWETLPVNTEISVSAGKSIYIKADGTYSGFSTGTSSYYQFAIDGSMSAHGSVLALLNDNASIDDVPNQTIPAYCFYNLFAGCNLTNIPELPTATMGNYAYANMFSGCTQLTAVDTLFTTTLSEGCYSGMFQGCTSLTSAPALPATTLATNCYAGMFQNCTSLKYAPELPATTLVSGCYNNIFNGCSTLNEIAVGFTSWVDGCTDSWVANVADDGVFTCPTSLDVTSFGSSRVPKDADHKWMINPDFLAFKALASDGSTISLTKVGTPDSIALIYSLGSKTNWMDYSWDEDGVGQTLTVGYGKSVYFKAKDSNKKNGSYVFSTDASNYYQFIVDGSMSASGCVAYMLDRANKNIDVPAYGFYRLFKNCDDLTTGPDEVSSGSAGAAHCYELMFDSCTNMVTGPKELPSAFIGESSYENMFKDCEALTTAPTIPTSNAQRALACYKGMFKGCKSLVNNIPSTLDAGWNLAESCFESMFEGCESLVSTPTLPTSSTNLVASCYKSMFKGCTSLTSDSLPSLPANVMYESCYESMFEGCTSLTTPAEMYDAGLYNRFTVAASCWKNMYKGCSSLESGPSLLTTELAESCFEGMFQNCTSLTKAPTLPQTTLAEGCYKRMFAGCTSLTQAPELPATYDALVDSCYAYMFNGCTSLRYMDVAFRLWYEEIDGHSSTDMSATYEWVENVASSGTFMCPATLTEIFDISHIPYGWSADDNGDYLCFTSSGDWTDLQLKAYGSPTTITYKYSYDKENWKSVIGSTYTQLLGNNDTVYIKIGDGELSTDADNYWYFTANNTVKVSGNITSLLDMMMELDTVPDYAFYKLFSGCGSYLSDFSELEMPATRMGNYAYANMFEGCTSLSGTSVPELPATTLGDYCYSSMFLGCTSLTNAPELPATTLATGCYSNMFSGCSALSYVPALPATTLVSNCYENMFYNCSSLDSIEVAFTKWAPEGVTNATTGWVTGVADEGNFVCPWALAQDAMDETNNTMADVYGPNMIPKEYTPETHRWIILTKTYMSMDYANGNLIISGESSPIYYTTDASLAIDNLIGTCVNADSTGVNLSNWLGAAVCLDSITYYAIAGAEGDIEGLPIQPTVNSLTVFRYPLRAGMCFADTKEKIVQSLRFASKASSEDYPVEIFIPDGTYDFGTESFTIGDYVSLIGESLDKTIIMSSAINGVFNIVGDSVYMQDMLLQNSGSGAAFTNRNLTTTLNVTIDDDAYYNMANTGISGKRYKSSLSWDKSTDVSQITISGAYVNGSSFCVTEAKDGNDVETNRFVVRFDGDYYSLIDNNDFYILRGIQNLSSVTIRGANRRGAFGAAYVPSIVTVSGTEYADVTLKLNSTGLSSFSYGGDDAPDYLQVSGGSVYKGIYLEENGTSTVYLEHIDNDVIPKGVGVIISGVPSTEVKFYTYGSTIADPYASIPTGAVALSGNGSEYVNRTAGDGSIYYCLSAKSKQFLKLGDGVRIKPNKAFFHLSTEAPAASCRIVFGWPWEEELEGDVTGITRIDEASGIDDSYYTLDGVKSDNEDAKGLLIKNNKVVLIK